MDLSRDTLEVNLDSLDEAPPAPLENVAVSKPLVQTHRFQFTGLAGEFFRIWIVNIFLSIAPRRLRSLGQGALKAIFLHKH